MNKNKQSAYLSIDAAFKLAVKAHKGQFRRDGVTPYINHPVTVADRVDKFGHEYVMTAYLHDVLEDSDLTREDLVAANIPESVIEAVELLTKHDDQSYDEYLFLIKQNEMAKRVKIADMLSNLSDNPTDKQIIKYAKGLTTLLS